MIDSPEQYSISDPLVYFQDHVEDRKGRLDYLAAQFEYALGIVKDLETVNALIGSSPRPDLVITQRVEQLEIAGLHELGRTNNFTPHMQAFGIRVYEDRENWKHEVEPTYVGRRRLTDEERGRFRLMGGRNGYDEFKAFAEANGIDKETSSEMMLQTHIARSAFMRMWILFPELTENLMDWCLEEVGDRDRSIDEELFVAYSIMSKLVDIGDSGVVRGNGELDSWRLCR